MLKRIQKTPVKLEPKSRFAIIASRYNSQYVDGMLRAARAVLREAKAELEIVRVPGAFEIPVVAARIASSRPKVSGVICLGVILRGETTHAQNIAESVSAAFALIQVTQCVPLIHEVLLLENEAQAKVRCLSRDHNRGAEAARTALVMAHTMRVLDQRFTGG